MESTAMPDLPLKKNALRRWGVAAVLLLLLSACAPTRTVYIPREWRENPSDSANTAETAKTTSPGAGARGRRSQTQAQAQTSREVQSTPSSQQFVLERPPVIKETEVRASNEPRSTPAEKKPAQPRHMASMHLVDQANAALAQGKTDTAISLFEQAVQVDVYNGSAFFGLARAWRTKGSRQKAMEFARKAEILFQDDRSRLKELYLFEASMFKDMGDETKEKEYRLKASKLSEGRPGK